LQRLRARLAPFALPDQGDIVPAKAVDFSVVRELALALPNVEDATSPRGVAFKVGGRLLACQAIHRSAEPDSLMVRVTLEERARLLADSSDACYVTDHYLKHPAVLVRLSRVSRRALRDLLAIAWIFVSEKSANAEDARAAVTRRAHRRKRPRKH
jgi:hypothetical protein